MARWPVLVAAATATIVIVAAVPVLFGGGVFGPADEAADTTIAAAETTEAPTTTIAVEAPETTSVAAEEIPFEELAASLVVSAQPVELPAAAVAAAEGLLIASVFEFEFADGAPGGASVLIVVEDGEATMLVGRFCGTEFGPPSFSDTDGGVIVNSPLPDIRRCSPGAEVEPLSQDGRVLTTAVVEGVPVAAILFDEELRTRDLDSGAEEHLASFDLGVEEPIAASYGGGRWMVSLRDVTGPFFPGSTTRYAFFEPDGTPVSVAGNPAPAFAPAPVTYRVAALTPDGNAIVFVEQFPDLSADVVVWDLPAGAEIERYRIIEPFVAPTEGVGGGEQFPRSIDVTASEIVVNIDQNDGEVHPQRIVRIDRSDGSVRDIEPAAEGIFFQIASFLDRP